MTTEDSTTPIHAFVRSDVVRSAFVSPLEASGWSMASLRDSTDLAALLRDAPYAVLLVDSSAAPSMPGPWIQGLFVGSGEAPDGLAARPFSTPVGQLAADLRRLAFTAQLAALRAGRVHQARGFLEDVPLRSCLAALVGRKASGTVRFASARGQGCIYLRDGRIIDVEVASLRGEEALARLLAWTEASVHVAEGSVLGDALITRATDDVFAEAERMAAAVAASLVLLPKAGVALELERFVASRIVARPSEELEKLLDLVDGTRDIVALLDASPFDDASTARTLARFAQGGALRAVGTTAQVEDVAPPSVALVARHTPANLPQVTLQMDAPKVSNAAPESEDPAVAEPSSANDDGQPVGASTPIGLFAVGGPDSSAPSSRPIDATPLTPGVEALRTATSAAVEVQARRTPISVETPAKAALDAAFRKAAQESQAAMTSSESYTSTSSRRSVPPPVNSRAMRLVGGISVAAIGLFAIVALKAAVGGSNSPAPAPAPVRVEAVAAAPAPSAEAPAPAAVAAPEPDVPTPSEAETAAASAPSLPIAARPPVAAAVTTVSSPSTTVAAPATVKLPPGRLQKAKDFLDQGNYVSASIEAQGVVQGDPSQAEGWLVLGAAAQAQGKDSEAKRFYSECARRGRGPSVEECRQLLAQ